LLWIGWQGRKRAAVVVSSLLSGRVGSISILRWSILSFRPGVFLQVPSLSFIEILIVVVGLVAVDIITRVILLPPFIVVARRIGTDGLGEGLLRMILLVPLGKRSGALVIKVGVTIERE
jgi:hypothetical protein